MSKKVWNLMDGMGTRGNVISSGGTPRSSKAAHEGVAVITRNAWRAWIERHGSGKVLFRNPTELAHRQSLRDVSDLGKTQYAKTYCAMVR